MTQSFGDRALAFPLPIKNHAAFPLEFSGSRRGENGLTQLAPNVFRASISSQ
jgi:hypothetical protein